MLLASFNKTDSVVQFLTLLVIFVFIIAVTYLTVRWMSRVTQVQSKYSNIDIIETKRIANNKYLQIVKAGDKYLLLGIGKDEVNLIGELTGSELVLRDENSTGGTVSFSSFLEKAKNLANKNLHDNDKE